jgi:dTMP kinase
MTDRGRFITFEGGEGAGKTTQITRLADAIRAGGHEVVETREPGGTPGAEAIRGLLVTGAVDRWDAETELLLLTAARRDHMRNLIEPSLAEGKWVLCDRYLDSTRAYQGFGHGVPQDRILDLHDTFVGGSQPDLTVILDIAPDEGLKRAGDRHDKGAPETRFESIDLAFHQKLRDGFLQIAESEPDRCVLIDASQDIEAIGVAVRAAVATRLGLEAGGAHG